jgi:hypothetical protein
VAGFRATLSVRECRMRFARPAAAGLGVGMLAGFAVALVRPRLPAPPHGPPAAPATGTPAVATARPPGHTADGTTSDALAGREAGSDFTGRVI